MPDKKNQPRLISVGTANPPRRYTQAEMLSLFSCEDKVISRFFKNSHIQTRHLVLPDPDENGNMPDEDTVGLLAKHLNTSLEIGRESIRLCLNDRGVQPEEIDYFVVVSSTGFLCPGLSAHLIPAVGLRPNVHRADLLGMGCNGGMNGLLSATQFAKAHPGKLALMLTCEICSAAYMFDLTRETGVVNSLFGDGAAAVLVGSGDDYAAGDGPQLIDFESLLVHEAIKEMRFDFVNGKFSFFLGREIPYLIGENVSTPVLALLARNGLRRRDISHWLVHAGGKKVIDSIKYNLGLTDHDLRYTRSILRDYGNLSSSSFLFSYQELTREKIARQGDWGVSIAMGPGTSIETGLLQW